MILREGEAAVLGMKHIDNQTILLFILQQFPNSKIVKLDISYIIYNIFRLKGIPQHYTVKVVHMTVSEQIIIQGKFVALKSFLYLVRIHDILPFFSQINSFFQKSKKNSKFN